MTNRLALLLIVALVSSFLFSGMMHALVPHSHDLGNEVLTQNMHAALRLEQKMAIVSSALFLVVITSTFFVCAILESVSVSPGTLERQLHKGIFKYRRFR